MITKQSMGIASIFVLSIFLIGCSQTTTPTADDDVVVVEDQNDAMDDTAMDDDMMDDADDAMDADEADDMEDADDDMMDDSDDAMEADVTIEISGVNFAYSQETIEVNEGDVVTINFTSEQGFHDWVVDEFDAATEKVETGGVTSVTFVADQVGEFEYYCSVGAHRENGMVGTLIVNAAE